MKTLTEAQRQQLFDALIGPKMDTPRFNELGQMILEDIKHIEPIIAQWLTPECPECRLPVDAHDQECSRNQEPEQELIVAPSKYAMRVYFQVLGGHTHFSIWTGKKDCTLGKSVDIGCMTNEEFNAWRQGSAWMEFVNASS
jgi:hypothetical protein